MKITAIKSFMTRFGSRPRVLVKVETDEGIHGWGEAYNHGPDRSIPPIVDYIFEMMKQDIAENPRTAFQRAAAYVYAQANRDIAIAPGSPEVAHAFAQNYLHRMADLLFRQTLRRYVMRSR